MRFLFLAGIAVVGCRTTGCLGKTTLCFLKDNSSNELDWDREFLLFSVLSASRGLASLLKTL
jgi:hypothetical protein